MPQKKSTTGSDKAKKAPKKAQPATKLAKALSSTKGKAAALASDPAVAEVVAAILVATAAALRNPAKARSMAGAAGEELKSATADVKQGGGALRKLVLDVARRSIDAIGASAGGSTGGSAAPAASRSGEGGAADAKGKEPAPARSASKSAKAPKSKKAPKSTRAPKSQSKKTPKSKK